MDKEQPFEYWFTDPNRGKNPDHPSPEETSWRKRKAVYTDDGGKGKHARLNTDVTGNDSVLECDIFNEMDNRQGVNKGEPFRRLKRRQLFDFAKQISSASTLSAQR